MQTGKLSVDFDHERIITGAGQMGCGEDALPLSKTPNLKSKQG